jgi:hypothetical protein
MNLPARRAGKKIPPAASAAILPAVIPVIETQESEAYGAG